MFKYIQIVSQILAFVLAVWSSAVGAQQVGQTPDNTNFSEFAFDEGVLKAAYDAFPEIYKKDRIRLQFAGGLFREGVDEIQRTLVASENGIADSDVIIATTVLAMAFDATEHKGIEPLAFILNLNAQIKADPSLLDWRLAVIATGLGRDLVPDDGLPLDQLMQTLALNSEDADATPPDLLVAIAEGFLRTGDFKTAFDALNRASKVTKAQLDDNPGDLVSMQTHANLLDRMARVLSLDPTSTFDLQYAIYSEAVELRDKVNEINASDPNAVLRAVTTRSMINDPIYGSASLGLVEIHRKSLNEIENLVDRVPDDTHVARARAAVLVRIAQTDFAGSAEDKVNLASEALAINKKLLRRDTDNIALYHDIAAAHMVLAEQAVRDNDLQAGFEQSLKSINAFRPAIIAEPIAAAQVNFAIQMMTAHLGIARQNDASAVYLDGLIEQVRDLHAQVGQSNPTLETNLGLHWFETEAIEFYTSTERIEKARIYAESRLSAAYAATQLENPSHLALMNYASALLGSGQIERDQGNLQTALQHFSRAAEVSRPLLGERPGPSWDTYQNALEAKADLHSDLGNLRLARTSYMELGQHVASTRTEQHNPRLDERLFDITMSLADVTAKTTGSAEDAIYAYDQARFYARELLKNDEGNLQHVNRIAQTSVRGAAVSTAAGLRSIAREIINEGDMVLVETLADNPNALDLIALRAALRRVLGETEELDRNFEASLAAYALAVQLYDQSPASPSDYLDERADRVSARIGEGKLRNWLGQTEEAVPILETAILQARELAADAGPLSPYSGLLGDAHQFLGDLLHSTEKYDAAIAQNENALAHRKMLLAHLGLSPDPSKQNLYREIWTSQDRIGASYAASGRYEHAIAAYEEALAQARILQATIKYSGIPREVWYSYGRIGETQAAAGNHSLSEDAFLNAIDTIEINRLQRNQFSTVTDQELSGYWVLVGNARLALARTSDARDAYKNSLDVLKQYTESSRPYDSSMKRIATAYRALSKTYDVAEEPDAQLAVLQAASEAQQKAYEKGLSSVDQRIRMADADFSLGTHYKARGNVVSARRYLQQAMTRVQVIVDEGHAYEAAIDLISTEMQSLEAGDN